MKSICFNHRGSTGGGGPVTFIYKTALELQKRGIKVMYDNPHLADAAICIIETGKFRRYCKGSNTKIILRIDGIYNFEYNKKFNRKIRPDMTALHNKLTTDIPNVHHVVYQSNWSKDRIDEEIVKRQDNNWSIIHNGVDIDLFAPPKEIVKKENDDIVIVHAGLIRDDYMMVALLKTYEILVKRHGKRIKLKLIGNMDAACKRVFEVDSKNISESVVPPQKVDNRNLPKKLNECDIFLGPRQGSSSDNVIAEAQACSLPVVIPSWGGNADMVKDGDSGIIVPTGHWDYGNDYHEKLADGIEKIIPDLDGFKKRARQHAVKELSIEKMVDKYLKAMGI